MLDRRRWDPYRVPRDLDRAGALLAALVIVAAIAFLLIRLVSVSD